MRNHWVPLALVGLALTGLQGCAALGLSGAAAGTAALQGGAGAVVKAGTEYKSDGTIYRTFPDSEDAVHAAILQAFQQLDLQVTKDEQSPKRRDLTAEAKGRKILVRLEPLTPVLSRMRLIVKEGVFRKDRATASELLAETEDALGQMTAARHAAPRHASRHAQR